MRKWERSIEPSSNGSFSLANRSCVLRIGKGSEPARPVGARWTGRFTAEWSVPRGVVAARTSPKPGKTHDTPASCLFK